MSQNEEPQISYTDEPIDKLEGRWGETHRLSPWTAQPT